MYSIEVGWCGGAAGWASDFGFDSESGHSCVCAMTLGKLFAPFTSVNTEYNLILVQIPGKLTDRPS